jgi:Family of unknown function (DUF6152)
MKRYITNAGLVAGVIICATPVKAHHSFAMFDQGKTITVTETVKEFQWTNPHVLIWVEVNDARNPQPIVWSIEATSPGNLRRQGWKQDSLKPGDRVEVIGNPLRDGNPGAGFVSLKILDTGEILGVKLPTPPKE